VAWFRLALALLAVLAAMFVAYTAWGQPSSTHPATPLRSCPPPRRRDVVHEDKFSWPTRGPNVYWTIASTMRSRCGVIAKTACK
jgi:hypothetical protein